MSYANIGCCEGFPAFVLQKNTKKTDYQRTGNEARPPEGRSQSVLLPLRHKGTHDGDTGANYDRVSLCLAVQSF
jgi:hypothetical protein